MEDIKNNVTYKDFSKKFEVTKYLKSLLLMF